MNPTDSQQSGRARLVLLALVLSAAAALAALLFEPRPDRPAGAAPRSIDSSPAQRPSAEPGLHGRVLAPDGEPLPGVALRLLLVRRRIYLPQTIERMGWRIEGEVSALTDARGRYRLHPIPAGSPTGMLIVEAAGYAPRYEPLEALRPGLRREIGDLRLGPGAALRGSILAAGGGPPGETLRVTLLHSLELNPLPPAPLAPTRLLRDLSTEVDARGEFALEHLPPGRYALAIEGCDAQAARISELFTLRAGATERLELRVERARHIEGEVRDSAGEPLAGAEVLIAPRDAASLSLPRRLRTDASGRFATALAPPEDLLRIEVRHAGYQDAARSIGKRAGFQHFLLVPRVDIVGRVLERSTRRPLAGVWLGCFRAEEVGVERIEDPSWAARSALPYTSDSEGRFRIPGNAQGRFRLVAKHRDFLVTRSEVVRVTSGRQPPEVEILLEPGLKLRIEVRRPDGRPLAGAGLVLRRAPRPGDPGTIRGRRRFPPEGHPVCRALTPADGVLTLRLLRPGRYRVYIKHPDFKNIPFTPVRLLAQNELTLLPIDLLDTVAFRGVLLVGGKPNASWKLFAFHSSGEAFESCPDEQGAYEIADLPAGEYRLVPVPSSRQVAEACWAAVNGERFEHPQEWKTTAAPGAVLVHDFDLQAPRTARVSGALRLAGRSYAVWFTPLDAPAGTPLVTTRSTNTDLAGHFAIDDLLFGRYRLVVTPAPPAVDPANPSGAFSTRAFATFDAARAVLVHEVTIDAAEVDLGFLAAPTALVSGRVRGADGESVGAGHLIVHRGAGVAFEVPIGPSGAFQIGELPSGPLELEVLLDDDRVYGRQKIAVSIGANRSQPLDITLRH